ncbi:MAG: bifunctional 5,10-methylenetetrahydrofolate dehydrogenase/5,10-methenyltetrahydrofolate cyclohydrolase [Candidatus Zixiibacteriota bacterium]|nr:MAG: bifunctional 5,10-methylenetetrahydrofolate dehydrogenase/5,10-methenyltetrahydrofolate cyclohydrolase [candidate division Zixibacteria bacterium]
MSAEIIDGKKISDDIKSELKAEIVRLKNQGVVPGLAAVLVGDNPASALYVKMKAKACEKIGIYSEVIKCENSTTHDEMVDLVSELNKREDIDGILVQSPLPDHIDEPAITVLIDPGKDVDGFHPLNQGLLLAGRPRFEPATPMGIVEILERSGHNPAGKNVVILGRGFLVGRPLSVMLSTKTRLTNATVTICHTGTPDISDYTKKADIIVAAMGKAMFLKGDMIKPGAVIIDVGTNQIDDPDHPKGKRLVGDVDFDSAKDIAGAITPVPGGVGPMTIAMLLKNTVKACKIRNGLI